MGVLGLAVKAARAARKRLPPAVQDLQVLRPRVNNTVVPVVDPAAKGGLLAGRALNRPEQLTHASRNISAAELDAALASGFFTNPAGGTVHTRAGGLPDNTKWWSAADPTGTFGRSWAKGQHTVRLPIGKLPTGRAASIRDMEMLDPATGQWSPLKKAHGGHVSSLAVRR